MTTTYASAAASGGIAGALVGVVAFGAKLAHVTIPADVAADLMVLATPVIHVVGIKLAKRLNVTPADLDVEAPPQEPIAAPVVPSAPLPAPSPVPAPDSPPAAPESLVAANVSAVGRVSGFRATTTGVTP